MPHRAGAASRGVGTDDVLAGGGDNFTVLTEGTNRLSGVVDSEAFADYIGAHSPVAPGPQNRITRVN